jgi:predicted site-specific integrase-resolvase
MPELMTAKEVMQFLRVKSPVTLWSWEKAGKLHPVKIGKSKLYHRSSIVALVKEPDTVGR